MATYKKYTEQYCKMKNVKHCFMQNIENNKELSYQYNSHSSEYKLKCKKNNRNEI